MSKLFGGSKSKSTQRSNSSGQSYNRAFPAIHSLYAPMGAYAYNSGVASRGDILSGGFDEYKEQGGFDFLKEIGLKNLMGQYAGGGVFQSGAAGKALQEYGSKLASTYLDNYLNQQNQQASLGLGVGNLLGQTGGVSTSQSSSYGQSTSKSSGGIGGFLGSAVGAIAASERHLKTNITPLYTLPDGLTMYEFEYKKEPGVTYVGTMVDEVEELRPWALGPIDEDGNKTVDYSKLEGVGD